MSFDIISESLCSISRHLYCSLVAMQSGSDCSNILCNHFIMRCNKCSCIHFFVHMLSMYLQLLRKKLDVHLSKLDNFLTPSSPSLLQPSIYPSIHLYICVSVHAMGTFMEQWVCARYCLGLRNCPQDSHSLLRKTDMSKTNTQKCDCLHFCMLRAPWRIECKTI